MAPHRDTSGVWDTGSVITWLSRSKTVRTVASVTTSAGVPSATMRPSRSATRWSAYRADRLRSCRTITTVVPRLLLRSTSRSSISTWWATSRYVVGSSSSNRSVPWARAIAIQTRWRWPPDSSSTTRSASSTVPVSASASATAVSSSRVQRRNAPWCGCRPRPTRSTTVTPSGAIGFWGSSPSVRATCLVDRRWMASPSRSTAPAVGRKQPRHPAQQCGLPAGVGADDDGHLVVGDPDGQARDDPPLAVPERDGVGDEPRRPGDHFNGGHAALLPVRPRASSQSRNGAPKAPVTTPTGKLVSASR